MHGYTNDTTNACQLYSPSRKYVDDRRSCTSSNDVHGSGGESGFELRSRLDDMVEDRSRVVEQLARLGSNPIHCCCISAVGIEGGQWLEKKKGRGEWSRVEMIVKRKRKRKKKKRKDKRATFYIIPMGS